ncbi:MAG: hypothetical protein WCN81_07910 [Actinomycetes bacterium]
MTGAVSLALAADEPASRRVADALFPEAEHRFLTRDELRPPAPFSGPLFELLAAFARAPGRPDPRAAESVRSGRGIAGSGDSDEAAGSGDPGEGARSGRVVGLVVPVVWRGAAACGGPAPATLPPGALLAVADHVNLALRGPLTGRWPAAVPRSFPPLTGIYQPAFVRARGGPRVYSSGVVVAGVADAGRLTPFEARAVLEAGIVAVSDSLVPAAVAAAYYGLTLAACGVPQADDNDEE